MENLSCELIKKKERPIRVVQFGEGNFLRAFANWMLDICNEKTAFNGSVAIVKPVFRGTLPKFKEQDCLYTVVLRGQENGKIVDTQRIITSVDHVVDGGDTWENIHALVVSPTVRFLISNTTEAGLTLDKTDTIDDVPHSFPGKVTKFLYERFILLGENADSMYLLPCELVEQNGDRLHEYVLALAKQWGLPMSFTNWVDRACVFCNTLVDRIVTGYPSDAEQLWEKWGYRDALVTVGEPFVLWVIEDKTHTLSAELPLTEAGLPVIFTDDLRPYREQKVRILNGAHTASVLAGWLTGKTIVREMLADPVMGAFVRQTVEKELVPYVPTATANAFAQAVFERFANPYIDHRLLDISLHSVAKWRVRVLPTLRETYAKTGKLPPRLTFSFAALLAFYTGKELYPDGLHATRADGTAYVVREDENVLSFFASVCDLPVDAYVEAVCGKIELWGEDMRHYEGFVPLVAEKLTALRQDPVAAVQNEIIQ